MSSGMERKVSPAMLADAAALHVFHQPDGVAAQPEDSSLLRRLDHLADEFDMLKKSYWVEASRGLSIPLEFDRDEEVTLVNYDGVSFEGNFVCYSKVIVGQIIGHASVRALCLTFNEATILPYMEDLREGHLLYVPVAAVSEMDATERLL